MTLQTSQICLITYDGELLFRNGGHPLKGLALFEGFEDENSVIEFIIDHRYNDTGNIFNHLFEEITHNLNKEKFKKDPVFNLLARNDEDFDELSKSEQVYVIKNFIKKSKKMMCAFALVNYDEKLFSILRKFDKDVWKANKLQVYECDDN
jgi:hypothetical protein